MCHVFRLLLPTPALESGEAMRAGAASDLGPHAQTRAEPSMQQVLRTGKEARRAFTGATAGEKSSESLAGPSQAVPRLGPTRPYLSGALNSLIR